MKERISVLLPEEEVERRIAQLGEQITEDYAGKSIHMICVLKGGAPFMCQLAKHIRLTVTMDFMAVSSYASGTESSGVVTLKKDLDEPLEGKHVIVVEDIIDSGRTLSYLMKLFSGRRPASLKLCTFLDKPSRRAVDDISVDYCGFVIPDKFVVGYGLDYDQRYRNLPYIGVVEFEEEEF